MPTIRERAKGDSTRVLHVQGRMSGFATRTASFPTLRQVERRAKIIEAEMIEGRVSATSSRSRGKNGIGCHITPSTASADWAKVRARSATCRNGQRTVATFIYVVYSLYRSACQRIAEPDLA